MQFYSVYFFLFLNISNINKYIYDIKNLMDFEFILGKVWRSVNKRFFTSMNEPFRSIF